MTVLDIYNQFNVIPTKFAIAGVNYEHTTMQHSDGTWYAYIFEMKGELRNYLYSCATGETESKAIENLIKKNSSQSPD